MISGEQENSPDSHDSSPFLLYFRLKISFLKTKPFIPQVGIQLKNANSQKSEHNANKSQSINEESKSTWI